MKYSEQVALVLKFVEWLQETYGFIVPMSLVMVFIQKLDQERTG